MSICSFSNLHPFQPARSKSFSSPSYSKTVRRAKSFRAGRQKIQKKVRNNQSIFMSQKSVYRYQGKGLK